MMQRPVIDENNAFPATQATSGKPAEQAPAAQAETPKFDFRVNNTAKPYRGPVSSSDRRSNGYGGKCRRCAKWVEPTQGWLTGSRQAGWGVEHKDGECPTETQATESSAQAAPSQATKVFDGRYTVQWQDGSYKTIRVTTQDQFDEFMPGRQILSYLSGSNNDTDYTRFGHIDEHGTIRIWKKHQGSEILREAVKVLAGDPKAASKAYAARSGSCGVCGRTLTTPESIANGIGPECARRTGW